MNGRKYGVRVSALADLESEPAEVPVGRDTFHNVRIKYKKRNYEIPQFTHLSGLKLAAARVDARKYGLHVGTIKDREVYAPPCESETRRVPSIQPIIVCVMRGGSLDTIREVYGRNPNCTLTSNIGGKC